MRITILPVGQVSMDALLVLKYGLMEAFPNTEETIHETSMLLPREAYNSSRHQYYSTRLLARVDGSARNLEADCVLGVTEADLYVPALNFVFGEAQMPGRAAIVSLFRLDPEFYGESPNRRLFHERALKEAIHEIGHTLGLRHCRQPTCVMYFSDSILATDRKAAEFCTKCRSSIPKALTPKS